MNIIQVNDDVHLTEKFKHLVEDASFIKNINDVHYFEVISLDLIVTKMYGESDDCVSQSKCM